MSNVIRLPRVSEVELFVAFQAELGNFESAFQQASDNFTDDKLRTAAKDVAGAINVLMQMIQYTVGQPNEFGVLKLPITAVVTDNE
jgi:hypothetical protein